MAAYRARLLGEVGTWGYRFAHDVIREVVEADLSAAQDWQAQAPALARRVLEYGIRSLVTVPLRARGVVLGR